MSHFKLPSPGEIIPTVEVIGYEHLRAVFVSPDGKESVPSGGGVSIIHLRFPGGSPFSVTVSVGDFDKIVLPELQKIYLQRSTAQTIPPEPKS